MVSLAHVPRGRGALTAGIKVLKEPRKRPAYTRAQHPTTHNNWPKYKHNRNMKSAQRNVWTSTVVVVVGDGVG